MNWEKTGNSTYTLYDNGLQVTQLEKTKATGRFIIDGHTYTIQSQGFWHHTIHILTSSGVPVVTLSAEKWYANTYTLHFMGHNYRLSIRNNPLCEWVISLGDTELLAYGLATDTQHQRLAVRIVETDRQSPFLHILLWHLFEPIARENFADNLWWQWIS